MEKIILTDIKGMKTPDHITLRIKRKDLQSFPKTFFIDFTIDEVRDATPRADKVIRRRR